MALKRFGVGFKSLFLGIRLVLKEPKLKTLYVAPILITLLLFSVVLYVFFTLVLPLFLTSLFAASSGFWATVAYYGAYSLSTVVGIILCGFITFVLAQIVASPFNSLLAERSLIILGKLEEQEWSFSEWVKISFRMAFVSIVRALILGAVALLATVMGFIPFLHLVAIIVGLFILATDCIDYSFEALHYGFKMRVRLYLSYWLELLGLACALGLTMALPVLNLVIIPIGAVSGAFIIRGKID